MHQKPVLLLMLICVVRIYRSCSFSSVGMRYLCSIVCVVMATMLVDVLLNRGGQTLRACVVSGGFIVIVGVRELTG
jgi:hypothetical protein